VLSGAFVYRSGTGAALMSPGSLMLGNWGQTYECSHEHGVGDRCLSFQFEPELLDSLAREAGVARPAFGCGRLPPLRALAPLLSRAVMAFGGNDSFEEIAIEMGAVAMRLAGDARYEAPAPQPSDRVRIMRVLRYLEDASGDCTHTLAHLAAVAGLSRYHFLRTFKNVVGVTPHQWLLRTRLRDAAEQLRATNLPITQIALNVGFEDLSNFIRSFRAEFGVSPRRYRAGAR
jgi:AraC-like DNA-binding protein